MMQKKFVYLVQGHSSNIGNFNFLHNESSDLFSLTYDSEIQEENVTWARNIYFPNSTWAEGRNRLLDEVIQFDYEYFIFIDDDIKVVQGSFYEFQKLLLEYKPQIGLPLCDVIEFTGRHNSKLEIQRPNSLDQLLQAYSKETVMQQIVLPYVIEFDQFGWWISCEINQHLILSKYRDSTFQFNTFKVTNSGHTWDIESGGYAESKYISGDPSEVKRIAKQYISSRYGYQQPLSNSLFHDTKKPLFIYAIPFLKAFKDGKGLPHKLKIVGKYFFIYLNNLYCLCVNHRNLIYSKLSPKLIKSIRNKY